MFVRNNSDFPPRDLIHVSLKEGQEQGVLQLILYRLKVHTYARGDVLHEGTLLLEGLLQAHICGLRVPKRHISQGVH